MVSTSLRLFDGQWRRAALIALSAGSYYGCGGGEDCGGPFCFGPGQPQATMLSPGEGNGQSGPTGRPLPAPIEVRVTDDEGNPIQDVAVHFTVDQGGGSLSDSEIRSDLQGRARVNWTLGADPGDQKVRAAANGSAGPLNGSPLILSALAVRPLPASIVIREAPPGTAANGIPFEQQPIVEVLDDDSQPVAQIEVVASIASGGGTLSGTTAISSDAAGRVTYTNLAILGTSGPRTIRFSVTDPAVEVVSGTIELSAGTPTTMVGVAPLAYQGTVNSPVSPPPSVVVRDEAGNTVPGVAVTFTTDRDADVSPATVSTNELGVAQVTSWTLGTRANVQYSLTARVESSTLAPVRFTATARPGAAGRLQIAAQPSSSARSGVALGQQPVIQIVDQNGNPTPQPNVRIEATVSSGPEGALRNATATTDASGRATFTALTLSGAVGNYTLSFSADDLAGVNSAPISLAAGPPAQLALVVAPPLTARSRVPFSPQPSVQVQDGGGNAVAQAGVEVVASMPSQEGTLAGQTTATTDGSGRATFQDLAITGGPGAKTLTFSSTGIEGTTALTRLPSVASIVVQTPAPSSAVVGTTVSNAPAWTLNDAQGQPVADAPAVLSASSGGSVVPVSATSDATGLVQVQTWTLGTTAGDQYVEITIPSTSTSSQVHIQALAGPASQLVMISGDQQSAPVNSALAEPLVVRVMDQHGNGVGDVTVDWRGCDGSGNYSPLTDPDGYSSADQPTGPEPGPGCTRASSVVGSVEFTYTVTAAAPSQSQSRTSRPAVVEPRGLPPVAPRSSAVPRPSR